MKKKVAYFTIPILLIFLTCVSCKQKEGIEHVRLPVDSPMHNADRYAVITGTYISLKDTPGPNGISIGHARKKEIYKIERTQFVVQNGYTELWVQTADGWFRRSSAELYQSREKAVTAASLLQ